MKWVKKLKHKTWIDWIKIILAIDLASAGLGLIFNLPIHIIAPIFGFITRILLGIFYIILAVFILKKVFPDKSGGVDDFSSVEIEKGSKKILKRIKKMIKQIEFFFEKLIEKIDIYLDKVEYFFSEKKKEAKDELHKIMHKKD